jgi:hypothetical protein
LDILRLKVGSLELTSVAWADVMLLITKKSTHKNLTPGFDEILPSFPRVFIIPCVMGHPVANKKNKLNNENTSAHCTRTSRTSKELVEKRALGNSYFNVFIGGVYGGKSFSSSLQLNGHTVLGKTVLYSHKSGSQIEVTILLRVQIGFFF